MTGGKRSVLITGCSSGIGRAAAHGLRGRGWQVFASARQIGDVAALRADGFEAVELDLASQTSIAAAVDTVLSATDGRLDALFNNGAYGLLGAIEDIPTEALRAQFETNLFGWHEVTRRAIPVMRAQGSGRIVQNSSILGLVAMPYRGAYVATKFALEGLSDALRLELAGTGIHVSLIEPGPIESRFAVNAKVAFERWIGPRGLAASAHRNVYKRRLARLGRGGASRFKLPPEAVVEVLVHALESRRPRTRYKVTTPTRIMGVARRVLPDAALDRLLGKAAAAER